MPGRRRDAGRGEAPRSRSKVVATQSRADSQRLPDLHGFLSDFKVGLGRLRTLTQTLVEHRHHAPPRPEAPAQREIMHTLERELRILERTAPPEIRDRVVREFRSKAETAIKMGIPQAYAQLMEAVRPAKSLSSDRGPVSKSLLHGVKALRPSHGPAVKSLLSAVKAIRSGRLAFLPRETRVETQKLLRSIFGSPTAGNVPRATQGANTVESQRILPLVVQGMMRDYENPEKYGTYIDAVEDARKRSFLPEPPVSASGPVPVSTDKSGMDSNIGRSAPLPTGTVSPTRPKVVPLTAQDIPKLAKAIPSFQTTGVAHAFMYEPDENVHAITKTDDLVTSAQPPDTTPPQGPREAGGTIPVGAGPRAVTMAAPTAVSNNSATQGDKSQSTLNVTDKPVTVTGRLSIDGLAGFIADTEMRLSGIEKAMRA